MDSSLTINKDWAAVPQLTVMRARKAWNSHKQLLRTPPFLILIILISSYSLSTAILFTIQRLKSKSLDKLDDMTNGSILILRKVRLRFIWSLMSGYSWEAPIGVRGVMSSDTEAYFLK